MKQIAICDSCGCIIEEPFFKSRTSKNWSQEHSCQKCATNGTTCVNYTMLITMDWSDFWFNKKQWLEQYAFELVGRFLFTLTEYPKEIDKRG